MGRDGRTLATSWKDSSVVLLAGDRLETVVGGLPFPPADVSRDERRGRIAIVSLAANRFELRAWQPTARAAGSASAQSAR